MASRWQFSQRILEAKCMAKKVNVTDAPVAQATGEKPKLAKLAVKQGVKLRGCRAKWYETLCKYDGKPAAEFLADTTKTPPSTPKSGVQEKSTGWLRYFVRTGVATLTQ